MDRPVASPTLEVSAAGGGEPGDLAEDLSAAPGFLAERSPRGVLETALTRVRAGEHAVLALVLETDGSTYAGAGDMVLFCNGSQVGWLSGGCLEPELARRAEQVSAAGRVDWIEIGQLNITTNVFTPTNAAMLNVAHKMTMIEPVIPVIPAVTIVITVALMPGVGEDRSRGGKRAAGEKNADQCPGGVHGDLLLSCIYR